MDEIIIMRISFTFCGLLGFKIIVLYTENYEITRIVINKL